MPPSKLPLSRPARPPARPARAAAMPDPRRRAQRPPSPTRTPALARDAQPLGGGGVALPPTPPLGKLPGVAAREARRHDERGAAWFGREAAYLAVLVNDLKRCQSDEEKVRGAGGGGFWGAGDGGPNCPALVFDGRTDGTPLSPSSPQVAFLRRNARVKAYFEEKR